MASMVRAMFAALQDPFIGGQANNHAWLWATLGLQARLWGDAEETERMGEELERALGRLKEAAR